VMTSDGDKLMSETLANERQHRIRLTPLRFVLGLAIVVLLVANMIELPPRNPIQVYATICQVNLRCLHDAFSLYARTNDGTYPTPAQWCDLILPVVKEQDYEGAVMECPKGRKGPCDYAMNPYADPCGPPDVVLLFESIPGWNRFGGADLLVTDNHEDAGASVVLVGGEVISVTTEQVDQFRWTAESQGPSDSN